MDWWTKIRIEVLRGETSKREILRREGIHWETLKKILEHSEPPGYRKENPRPKPKIGPFLEQIDKIIKEDKHFPKKQRHTAKRIYERIKSMGSIPVWLMEESTVPSWTIFDAERKDPRSA